MPIKARSIPNLAVILIASCLSLSASIAVHGQSQEPKPGVEATPVTPLDVPAAGTPVSGVTDSSWEGPNWGVRLSWDPATWSVEGELIEVGYDGLRIGTPASSVFIEAYDGFSGDAGACLADAEQEIGERESVSEVATLSGRPLPTTGDNPGPSRLFGLVARLASGEPFRGTEFVECRTLVEGEAVLEITWQTAGASYNDELPLVEALLTTLKVGSSAPAEPPLLPSAPPLTEPATAHHRSSSTPERARAK